MKKKNIIILVLLCSIFFTPTLDSHAASFPVMDSVDDVSVFNATATSGPGTPIYYPPCDIYSITTNNTHLKYTFVGQPVIDNKHMYSVNITWDNTGAYSNYTLCVAGNLNVIIKDSSNITTTFYNGTFSMTRDNSNNTIWTESNNNSVTLEGCDRMTFPVDFANLTTLPVTSAYQVSAWARVPEHSAVYPLLDVGPGNDLTPTQGGMVCDSAGSGFCWIPWPDEGAIDFPIIITIIGTSFIAIIVIRRIKSGGKHI